MAYKVFCILYGIIGLLSIVGIGFSVSYESVSLYISSNILCTLSVLFLCVLYGLKRKEVRERLRKNVFSGRFIYYKNFEKDWYIDRPRGSIKGLGYRYINKSGCFVIIVYNDKVTDGNYRNYDRVYIGHSKDVCHKVNSLFRGNKETRIFSEIEQGRYVYVRFILCDKVDFKRKEKEWLDFFNSTNSRNKSIVLL